MERKLPNTNIRILGQLINNNNDSFFLFRENKSKWWNTVVGLNHHEVEFVRFTPYIELAEVVGFALRLG